MPSSPRGHVVDASGDVIGLLGRKRVVRVRRLAFVIVFAFVSWSCFQGAQNSIRAHRKRSLLHTHYVANARERVKSELAPCIDPNEETARAMESSSSDESALQFVTFAFTRDPGARWKAASARRALGLVSVSRVSGGDDGSSGRITSLVRKWSAWHAFNCGPHLLFLFLQCIAEIVMSNLLIIS